MAPPKVLRQPRNKPTRPASTSSKALNVRKKTRVVAEEALLHGVFDNPHLILAYMDGDFNFIRVSHAYALADGKTPDYFVGKNHFELFPHPENQIVFQRVVDTGIPHVEFAKAFDYKENPERGTTYWDWSLIPVPDTKRRKPGLILVLTNVTERMRAQQALEEERNLTDRALDTLNQVFFVYNLATNTVCRWNDQLQRLLGVNDAVLRKGNVLELVAGDKAEELRKAATLASQGTPNCLEVPIKCGPGDQIKPYEFCFAAVGTVRTCTIAVIGRDASERRRLERDLIRSQSLEAVGTLANGIAHDFNNILAIISGSVDTLQEEDLSPGDLVHTANQIGDAVQRGRDLTSQLLSFGRKQILEDSTIPVEKTLRKVVDVLGRTIGKHIQMILTLPKDIWDIRFDATQLDRIVLNLCINARDAMPNGGRLDIRARNVTMPDDNPARSYRPGHYVAISFSDTGIGMDALTLARALEPYFTTKGQSNGTGMGLPTVYGIVSQAGGYVEIESHLNRGTTVTIYVPAHGHEASVAQAEQGAAEPSQYVLLVDDEPVVRDILARKLEKSGFTVLRASNGQEAISILEGSSSIPSALVTDLLMPHIDGRQLADYVRQRYPTVPVIYISGFVAEAAQLKAEPNSTLLEKPFSPSVLVSTVRSLVGMASTSA